ncbi:sensor domain-containing diguanylate cyclase [Lutispora thermophila]|uniref:sensor domain-containing diguanylate cyclase n=1 Tax=Lutispora thermophila TaxID=288966 RepID=UPI001FA86F9D|nr:diguanylate cyclase [Lutispora thermophila]
MILIIATFLMASCSNHFSNSRPKAQQGIMDLTQIQFENHVIQLDGEWEFYWNQLIDPNEIDNGMITGYIDVPSSWNHYKTEKIAISGDGYATYRLTFLTDKKERLALKIPRMHTAYKLWVNGELMGRSGIVGTTKNTMTPQYLPQVAFFEANKGKNEVVIQVSNFYHRSGGILESIKLGSEKQILGLRYKKIAYNIFLFGCLMCMGTYHLALFIFRKKNTSALYFGTFCILIGIRTLLVGECFLIYLFPQFNWEIYHKIMTLTYYLGVPIIWMYFRSVFPTYFNVRILKVAQMIGTVFGALVILTPARIFTVVNPLYQIWTIIAMIYLSTVFIKISANKEKDSWFIVLGASAFLLSTLNDIIFVSVWMNDSGSIFLKTMFRTGDLSSTGLLVFAFANSLLLAKKFSKSLEQEEIITAKLTEVNKNLDKIVLHRTEALVKANEKIEQQKLELEKANRKLKDLSLRDPLTELWNRRKYDESIKLEWERCLKYKRPIALIIMDVDYFKEYNDYYGHLAGDKCLIKVGQTVMSSLSGSNHMVARYGGEEFIVILPDTDKEEAVKIADMLRQNIEALHIFHEQSLASNYVTVSLGVSCTIPDINISYEDLFRAADMALYQSKDGGRNQVNFCTIKS